MFKKAKETTSSRAKSASKGYSVLGPTLTFKGGELSSDEDLIIEGIVEGKIAHQTHHLTIGESGKVKADVRARIITVEGTIEGDLHGDEAVHIASTARVTGNIVSPRITIEDGASFDGSIKTTQASIATAPVASEEAPKATGLTGSVGVRARQQQVSEHAETG